MLITLNVFLILLLIIAGSLMFRTYQLSNALKSIQEEVISLKTALELDSKNNISETRSDTKGTQADDIKMLIAVEVTNAFELAKRESKMAKYVIDIVPDLIKQTVYKQVVINMKEELAREGVENNISIIYQ